MKRITLIINNVNSTRVRLRQNLLYLNAFVYPYLMMTVCVRSKHVAGTYK
jgi:hypothetical protein